MPKTPRSQRMRNSPNPPKTEKARKNFEDNGGGKKRRR